MFRNIFVGSLFFLTSITLHAETAQQSYLNELVKQATLLKLAQHKEWLNLNHYQPNFFSGYTSEIISQEFFNASDGMINPEAELKAILASFFSKVKETDKQQNPQCHYISRYHWLKKKLKFDPARLPERRCQRFDDWIKNISPDRVTLIFPAGTENSPSSMFGHTLFRIDKKDQSERTRLSSYSINFAADTEEANGLAFAIGGIFGGYPGRFSIMPYYEKVRQYNDMEHRDIWEYQLKLTVEELTRLLQHTWELGKIDFAYYFFLENCSYQLLALLDVARPGHDMKERFTTWAIPSDTVAVMLEDKNIFQKAVYRPSARTKIRFQISNLTSHEQDLVLALTFGEIQPTDQQILNLSVERQALLIITAYDYFQYAYSRGAFGQDILRSRSLMLLRARNKLPVTTTFPAVPAPAIRFDQGHDTSRIAVGGGAVERDGVSHSFSEIKYRPSYHSLLDDQAGYTKGAQINFSDFSLRYNEEDETVRLHEWMIIDIYSLSPRDRFFKPVSWKVNTGFVRRPIGSNFDDELVYSVNGGFGLNYGLTDDLNTFIMLDISLLIHDDLPNEAAIAAGPSLGMMWRVTSNWNLWLSGSVQHYDDSLDLTYVEYRMEQNIALTTNTALRLVATETGDRDHSAKEVKASLSWYFK